MIVGHVNRYTGTSEAARSRESAVIVCAEEENAHDANIPQ